MLEPVLTLRNVQKRFASVHANRDISFEVNAGEIFALLGPNGAGKSTLIRMILGILRPDDGTIDLGSLNLIGDVGYLPEDRGLYKDTPVLRTLAFFGRLRGMPKGEAFSCAEAWLERLDLKDRAKDKLDTLSKGNQQKVQFASAIIHRPRLAVLDEPFSGLDPINQEKFVELIRELRDQGTTVLLSAHQMNLVERLADRLALIREGRLVQYGTLPEIRQNLGDRRRLRISFQAEVSPNAFAELPGVLRVDALAPKIITVEMSRETSLSPLLSAAASEGLVLDVHSETVSLHDLYLRAVGATAEEEVLSA